jgi:hypothetical protein
MDPRATQPPQPSQPGACRGFRERALAGLTAPVARASDALPSAMLEHTASCSACAQWIARASRVASALTRLERLAAPAELDGRVVSAFGAGARQQRAVEVIARLGRLHSPPELDGAVDSTASQHVRNLRGRRSAPQVLERLVSEELADPAKARVRRFVGSLRRLSAPSELDARVRTSDRRSPRRGRTLNRRVAAAGLLAALLGIIATPLFLTRPAADATRYPFRVERVGAFGPERSAHLSPLHDELVRELIDGASGGMLSANRIKS